MKIFSLLCLCLLVISCGKKDHSGGKRTTRISQEQVDDILNNQRFTCASINGTGCPRGMARLLTINQQDAEQSYVCSGFMVGTNRLVTNHHCVPSNSECRNTYMAVYTGIGAPFITRCLSILRTDEDYADPNDDRRAIDYSVLEVEGSFASFFRGSSIPAEANDEVKAWVIDHTGLDDVFNPNLYESRVTEFRCQVQEQTEKASLMLDRCPVISGNSGSPLFNLANRVVGVIWGSTAGSIDSSTPLSYRRTLDEQAAATEAVHFQDFLQVP